ncbi:MAG TPA: lipid-A-disaccharide synthase-related protein [bacterium]|nr:lipid-A-disaccharide synthase-related protein [bacterium]
MKPRLLIVSNGYGEDLEAAQIVRALPADRVAVSAYPLVGLGRSYPPDVELLDPRRDLPSGGFGIRAGWRSLWADLRAGWWRMWRSQRRTLRAQRGRVGLVLAAGDVYCLGMAAAAGAPTVYLALPKSEYISPHSPLELGLIRRFAAHVFTRDEVTADALRRQAIEAQYVGFTLMDTLALTGETFGFADGRPVVTVLPGSKPPAFNNLGLLLRTMQRVAAQHRPAPGVLIAWAPNLDRDRLRRSVEAAGGRWSDERHFSFGPLAATVASDHFADALARGTVVLGMAGAAHEQAAGLGKPVVAFPGTGPQFTAAFVAEQHRLLGDALVAARSPEDAADAVIRLLGDPAERDRRGRVGRERQGGPGGAAAIARYLLTRLAA